MRFDVHIVSLADCPPEELVHGDDLRSRLPISAAIGWRVDELSMLAEGLKLGRQDSVRAGFSLVAGESQQCPWVISIPCDLARSVACLGADEISELAGDSALWAGEPPSSVRRKLNILADFFNHNSAPFALYVTTAGDRESSGR